MSVGALPPVYIVSATRTPIGAYLGSLSSLTAPQLGAIAIKAALERAKVAPELVGEVFMGNVLSAGIGQAPARQAAIYARHPRQRARHDGQQGLRLGPAGGHLRRARRSRSATRDVVVAGGMESMSNVPYYLRQGAPGLPHGQRPRSSTA